MSYLYPIGSETEYGVLEVGNNINVLNGIISIPQSINITDSVTFSDISATNTLKLNGNSVITNITPSAGLGISLTNLISGGPNSSFTVSNTGVLSITTNTGLSSNVSATGDITITNTGVLSLTAGNNILLSGSTGSITISATGTGTIETYSTSSNYTALPEDEYIGVTASPAIITLPEGIDGKTYIIKNENAGGNVSVTGTGEQIDGSNSRSISNNASITVVFSNGQWRII